MTTPKPEPNPVPPGPDANPTTMPTLNTITDSTAPSASSSDAEATPTDSTTLDQPKRPELSTRKSSGTNIVPRDHPEVEIREERFPPGDARAMSPRRTSVEMEKLGRDTRLELQNHARTLQSGLDALAEKIETVKSDHEKLEKQNLALQDYIGGLTRSMSRTDLAGKGKK
ncbi:hypothetical protein MMC07_003548 [Pseudocyphellaria aurata]|nr:hypothetical protein [Pseudocyphellaria aurata]